MSSLLRTSHGVVIHAELPSHREQVAAFGVVTAPVWLTALLLARAWMFLRQRWRQQRVDDEAADGLLGGPVLDDGGSHVLLAVAELSGLVACTYKAA